MGIPKQAMPLNLQSKSLRVFDVAHVAKVTLKGKVEARVHKRHKHMILAELDV